MPLTVKPPKGRRSGPKGKRLQRLIENDLIRKVSYDEYRDKVQKVYGGPKGAILSVCSMMSLHIPLGERIFRSRTFDLRGAKAILDVGSGAGQIAGHLHRPVPPDAPPRSQPLEEPPSAVRLLRPLAIAVP